MAAEELVIPDPCHPYLSDPPKPGDRINSVDVWLSGGRQWERAGDPKRAIADYCSALILWPTDYRIYGFLVDALLALGDHDGVASIEAEARQRGISEDTIQKYILSAKKERENKRQAEAERKRRDQERQTSLAADAAREVEERTHREITTAERATRLSKFLARHHAADLSEPTKSVAFHNNPFAYQGQHVFLSGGYHKNIGRREAIVAIAPSQEPTDYIVQWDTARNLAELAVSGSPFVRCVVKVLGTARVIQGIIEREIPHVQEVECLK